MVRYEGKVVIALQINGESHEVMVRSSDILLDVIRKDDFLI